MTGVKEMLKNERRRQFMRPGWLRISASSLLIALSLLWPLMPSARAQNQKLIDQILVLVDGDIITRSDLIWNMALEPKSPSPAGPVSSDLLSLELDVTINQRLIAHEAARVPSAELTQDEVNKRQTELIAQFPSEAAFRQRIESVGMTPEKLEDLVRELIARERFIDFRFRSFVFVTEQEIQAYYEKELVPKIRAQGAVPPGLDAELPNEKRKVRDSITEILKAEKIEQEEARWLKDATQRAEIVRLAEP